MGLRSCAKLNEAFLEGLEVPAECFGEGVLGRFAIVQKLHHLQQPGAVALVAGFVLGVDEEVDHRPALVVLGGANVVIGLQVGGPLLEGHAGDAVKREESTGRKVRLELADPPRRHLLKEEFAPGPDSLLENLRHAFVQPDGQVGVNIAIRELMKRLVLQRPPQPIPPLSFQERRHDAFA